MENLDDQNNASGIVRKPILKRMLQRINANILLLQEINTISALIDLISGTKYEDFEFVHTKMEAGTPYVLRNLVILSKWPITHANQYLHELVPSPVWKKVTAVPSENEAKMIKWERPILHCQVNLNGNNLHVITIHLKSFAPTKIAGQTDPLDDYVWLSHSGWTEGYYISDIKRVGRALETRALLDNIFGQEGDDALIILGGL